MRSVQQEDTQVCFVLFSLQKPVLLRMFTPAAHDVVIQANEQSLAPRSQGPECQTKDWKKHKYNCSLLPDGPLLPAHIAPNGELDLLVRQVGEMIREVLVDWKVRILSSSVITSPF